MFIKTALKIIAHPALLFEIGNVALAFGYATNVAIAVNVILVITIIFARYMTVERNKPYDVSFAILAAVGLFTAVSIIYKTSNSGNAFSLTIILAILTYVFWAIGHVCAGYLQHVHKNAKSPITNPQFHYGIGDSLVVNVQGYVNWFSFPFTLLGFIKSMLTGKKKKLRSKKAIMMYEQVSSARLYCAGFFLGAVASIAVPHLAIAQLFWGLAYLLFGKDTE